MLKRLLRRVLSKLSPDTARKLIRSTAPIRSKLMARASRDALPIHNDSRYSASRSVMFNLGEVSQAINSNGIEYAILPSPGPYNRIIVVSAEDYSRTVHVLTKAENLRQHGFMVRFKASKRPMRRKHFLPIGFHVGLKRHQQTIVVSRPLKTENGKRLSTRYESITIQAWDRLPQGIQRDDGGGFQPGTLHRHGLQTKGRVAYLEPNAWEEAQHHPEHRVTFNRPLFDEVTFPVDVVYTWVDGDDPRWRRRMQQEVTGGTLDLDEINETATSDSRFVSNDELKYSLRSVAMYADWVRNIYIVTDQQVPDWLNVDDPRIKVVDHRDIFNDIDALPVFNSHAIESQLHHIDGLSRHYLYLNDDIFFCRPTRPSLFFTSSGLSRFFLSRAVLDMSPATARDLPVLSAAKNNRKLLEETFGSTITNKFKHTPHAQNRDVLKEMEERYPEIFDAVMRSKFRHPDDYSITSALYHYYAYFSGKAIEGQIKYSYVDVTRYDLELVLWLLLRQHNRWDVLCLNQTTSDVKHEQEIGRQMQEFLEEMFPIQSPFERN